jgi:c-di-GMP-binding flagellar brake protein YcgR
MTPSGSSSRPRARILGPGLTVILEDPRDRSRMRVRVLARKGRKIQVAAEADTSAIAKLTPGTKFHLRAARSFGLFCFRTAVTSREADGSGWLELSAGPARRRQMRDYFRMAIRLGVHLEIEKDATTMPILRAINLSAGGVLLLDPQSRLALHQTVRLGLPIGTGGEMWRARARVIRVQDEPRRAALAFTGIQESERVMLLRFILREHRRRKLLRARKDPPAGRIVSINERP